MAALRGRAHPALRGAAHPAAADGRLQLREALAGLASPDLQQQSVCIIEALLKQADGPLLDFFLREALLRMGDCQSGGVRRLRYRLAAQALRAHASAPWEAGCLLAARDLLAGRVGLEDNGPAAAELSLLAGQLAASSIDAYCHGHFAALGRAGKAALPRAWLCDLLLEPLLRAACKGPARTRVANACLMAHGVLLELRRWAKSAGVLHAAVDCLKLMLKLTSSGALALSAGEALLPVQGCVALLGPRLKSAALDGILRLCTQAMQRGEWQVRKAAADTLAALVEALQSGEPAATAPAAASSAAAGGAAQQQAQGLAALEGAAPAMAAAVERHLKYDRIPQVRQAAAQLLQLLQRLPSARPQEQQPLAQQVQAAGRRGGPAVQPAAGAAPAGGTELAGSGAELKAVIAQRRRQLQEAGWQPQPAVVAVKSGPAIGSDAEAGGGELSGAAKTGGPFGWENLEHVSGGSIRAWAGLRDQAAAATEAEAVPEQPPAAGSRPPSADVFAVGAAALNGLAASPAAAEARSPQGAGPKKRRVWGSRPSSPAKQHSVPVEVFAPPERPGPAAAEAADGEAAASQQGGQQAHVWRHNPLAQSGGSPARAPLAAAGGAGRMEALAARVAPTPCVHHVEHPQFALTLQAAPPSAELRMVSTSPGCSSTGAALQSVRLWAQQEGADVGVEFSLLPSSAPGSAPTGATLHRYMLVGRQLRHECTSQAVAQDEAAQDKAAQGAASAAASAAPAVRAVATAEPAQPASEAAAAASVAPADTPLPAGTPQTATAHGSGGRAAEGLLLDLHGLAAGPPAESPLASLATAQLPSFSPAKPAGRVPASTAAISMAELGEAACTPSVPATAHLHGTPSHVPATWPHADSSSPALQGSPVGGRWAASLRPPGEQLLPGLPDWDRSRPGSPGVGGSRSQAGSRQASPPRDTSRSRSPSRSRPGSPARQSLAQQPAVLPPEGRFAPSGRQQQRAEQQEKQPDSQRQAEQRHAQPPLIEQQQRRGERQEAEQQPQQQGEQQRAPGPLTAMVRKSLSKLQQLHELEEELHLPACSLGLSLDPSRAAGMDGSGQQAGEPSATRPGRQPVGRSAALGSVGPPEPPLSAIHEEGLSDEDSDGGSERSSRARVSKQQGGSTRSGQGSQMGRLQRLQEQLQANMREVQRRMGSLEGEQDAPAGEERTPGAASCGSDDMPAAWDAQEDLPAPPSVSRQYQQSPGQRYRQEARGGEGLGHATWQLGMQDLLSPAPGSGDGQGQQLPSSRPGISAGSSPAASEDGSEWRALGRLTGRRSPEGEEEEEEDSLAAGQQAGWPASGGASGSGGAAPLMVATSNPLFGSSRPGTAQSVHGMHDMLPPKASLAGQRRGPPQGGGDHSAAQRPLSRQRRSSPQLSAGMQQSLGSLGSGFSALRNESEAEVQQFLRGSLAGPRQQHQQQPQQQQFQQQQQQGGSFTSPPLPPGQHATAAAPAPALPAGVRSSAAAAGLGIAGRLGGARVSVRGSLDLGAILDSRPASPSRLPGLSRPGSGSSSSSSSRGDGGEEEEEESGGAWHTARGSRGAASEGWHTARERPAGPAPRRFNLWSSSDDSSSGGSNGDAEGSSVAAGSGRNGAGPGSLPGSATAQSVGSSPAAASRRWPLQSEEAEEEQEDAPASADLQLLRISARSPGRGPALGPAGSGAASPAGSDRLAEVVEQTFPEVARERLASLKRQLHSDSRPCSPGQGSSDGGSAASDSSSQLEGGATPASLSAPLPPRKVSPELPGLPVSRRLARVLQAALGHASASADGGGDVSAIQAVLQEVLEEQTAHVQAHYQQAAQQRLAALRRGHAGEPAALARALEAAQEDATRSELSAFLQNDLPRLAELLGSEERLQRCFEAAGGERGGGSGGGAASEGIARRRR